jgi:pilin isopeptide linkage protein
MEKKCKKLIALLLAFLMVLSVCLPNVGFSVNDASAKGNRNSDIEVATPTDAMEETAEIQKFSAGENAETESLTVSSLELSKMTSDGVWEAVSTGQSIPNGTSLRLSFNWEVNNTATQIDKDIEVSYDLNLFGFELENITTGKVYFSDSTGVEMGTYTIIDGVFTVTIKKDYYNEHSDKNGKAQLEGVLDVDQTANEDKNDVTLSAGGQTWPITVTYDKLESVASVSKELNGSVTKDDDGNLIQSYKVTVKCLYDDITNLSLTDTPGKYITSIKDFTYNGETYDSIADVVAAATNSGSMSKDENFEFTYNAIISEDCYAQNTDWDGTQNTITTTYKSNTDGDGEESHTSSTAQFSVNKPSVSKSGSIIDDGATTKWTISINCGDFTWDDVDLSSAIDTYKENITGGAEITKTFSKSDFTASNDGKTYTYTYEVPISDTTKDSVNAVQISNKFENVKVKGYSYSGSAGVKTGGSSFVNKKCANEYIDDNGNKILVWEVTLAIPDTTVTGLRIEDRLPSTNTSKHVFENDDFSTKIYVNDTSVAEWTINEWNVGGFVSTDTTNSIITQVYNSSDTYFQIGLTDDYVAKNKGKDVVIRYESVITEATTSGKTFSNAVNVTYNESANGFSASGSWTDDSVNVLFKSGATDESNDSVQYVVKAYLSQLGDELQPGKITISDKFDSDFMKITSLDEVMLCTPLAQTYEWGIENLTDSTSMEEADDGTVYFTLNLTQDQCDAIKSNGGLKITYTAKIKDPLNAETGKAVSFKNHVQGELNGTSLGEQSVTNSLTPNELVSKSVTEYTAQTAPYMSFTINVNPTAADLVSGDTIQAVDTMGENLIMDSGSTVVVSNAKTGQVLTEGEDYTYEYDLPNRKLTFTLPDSTSITITYKAKLTTIATDADDYRNNTELTFANSGNTFTLEGKASTDTSDYYKTQRFTYVPSVSGTGDTASLTLYKFYTNEDGSTSKLGGSTFEVYETIKNSDNTYSIDETKLHASKTMGADENEWQITDLLKDTVYALKEVGAASGFKVNDDIVYFAILGKNKSSLPSTVKTFAANSVMEYENEVDEESVEITGTAQLSVTKSVTGNTGYDSSEEYEFTIAKDTNNSIKSDVLPTETTVKVKGGKTGTFGSITYTEAGTYYYTITETKGTTSGMSYDTSTRYAKVVVTENTASKKLEATVTYGTSKDDCSASSLTVTNKYGKTTYVPEITKVVAGTDVPTTYVYNFVLTDKSNDKTGESIAVNGTKASVTGSGTAQFGTITYTKAGTYTYEITETAGSDTGITYSNSTVTLTVTVTADSTTGALTATGTYSGGDTDNHEIKNTYTAPNGNLVITKTIKGNVTQAEAEGAITFKVTSEAGFEKTYTLKDENVKYDATNKKYTITISGVPVGTYTVEETTKDITGKTVTVKYQIEDGNQTTGAKAEGISVTSGNTSNVAFENDYADETGSIELTKTIKGNVTQAEAEGAITFKVTSEAGFEKTYTLKDENVKYDATNKKYTITISGVPVGTYTVEETTTDITGKTVTVKYQIGNGDQQTGTKAEGISVTSGNTSNVAFENDYADITTEINVVKVWADSNNQDGTRPTTITINLLANGNVTKSQEVTADANGDWKCTFDNLPTYADGEAITYSIGEKKVDGYTTSIKLTDAVTNTYTVTNTYNPGKVNVSVTKVWVDENNKYSSRPDSIKVQLYAGDEKSGNEIELNADNNWYYEWQNLDEKASGKTITYTVDEVGTVAGYEKTSVEESAENSFTITNTLNTKYENGTVTFSIKKYAAGTTETVAGAVFALTDSNNNEVATQTTGKDGVATFTLTPTGNDEITYKLSEKSAPEGYVKTNDTWTVTVKKDGTVTVTPNTLDPVKLVYNWIATITGNDINKDDDGNYIVYNKKVTNLVITKTIKGAVTADEAEGLITFTVYDSSNNKYKVIKLTDADLVTYDKDTDKYTITLTGIPADKYTVEETTKDITGKDVTVTYSVNGGTATEGDKTPAIDLTNGGTANVDFENDYADKTGKITFTKVGSYKETCSADSEATKPLEGAIFELYDADGKEFSTVVTATSDADGNVTFDNLAYGTYTIKEIIPADGYVLNNEVYKATIDDTNAATGATLKNADGTALANNQVVNQIDRTDIKLLKVKETNTSETLPDSTYALYVGDDLETAEKVAERTTDENGELVFEGVLYNKNYIIVEVAAPDGSYVSESPIAISYAKDESGKVTASMLDAGEKGGNVTATMDDEGNITWLEPDVMYSFVKLDEDGNPLAGAELSIIDENKETVASWTSEATPYSLINVLVAGKTYALHEVKAPEGYELAADVSFTVDLTMAAGDSEVVTVTMTDKKQKDTSEDTTKATTEDTSEDTTKATTEDTSEDTTKATTEDTSEATTEATTKATTEATTEAVTEKVTEEDTEAPTEEVTETTTEAVTEATTEVTTEEVTTETTTEVTTTEEVTTETTTENTSSVPTGDDTPIIPAFIIFFASAVGTVTLAASKKKDKKKSN